MEDRQQSVILRIGSDYYSLTPAEKRLADYILANQERVVRQSISELAQQSGVAEATISRFSRHMGYKSFPLLKLAVANAMAQARLGDTPLSGQVEQSDDLKTMSQKLYRADVEAMMQTMEVLDLSVVAQVAGLFHKARQIMCMGQGGSMLIAREAAHLFSTVSNKFWPVEDSHLQAISASTMESTDVLFFFSYSGSTRDVLEITAIARERGAKVVLVTRFPNSPVPQFSGSPAGRLRAAVRGQREPHAVRFHRRPDRSDVPAGCAVLGVFPNGHGPGPGVPPPHCGGAEKQAYIIEIRRTRLISIGRVSL